MKIYFTNEFITILTQLSKSKHHKNIEQSLINDIFTQNIETIAQKGIKRLNKSGNNSVFIRKRIADINKGKSGGYRLYAMIIFNENGVYILYIHSKTGKNSSSNLTNQKQKELTKTYKQAKKDNEFIEVSLLNDKIVNSETKKQILD